MTRRTVGGLVLGIVAFQAACGGGSPPDPADQAREEGLPDSTAPIWAADEVWLVKAEPRLEVGVFSGAEEYQLVDVSAGALQRDGDLILADAGAATVRLYHSDGSFDAVLGGPGDGPGEFRNPQQIVVDRSDDIAVWDASAWRVTRYDAQGNFKGVQSFGLAELSKLIEPPLYPGSGHLLASGELVVQWVQKELVSKDGTATKNISLPPLGRHRDETGALRVAADLSEATLVRSLAGEEQVTVEAPWGPVSVVPPLAKRSVITTEPGTARFCMGDQEGSTVSCYGPNGTESMVNWRSDPIRVRANDPDIDRWRTATEEVYGEKLSPDDVRRLLDQVPVPEHRPPYSTLVLDAEGNLWVERGPTADGASVEYLVFNSDADLMGSVNLPPVRVLEIGADYLLVVRTDEFEVQYVQVLPLTKPARQTHGQG